MAFIAPFVGAALGLGAVGTSLLGAAVGIGLSFAARELRPKQKKSTGSEARGVRVGLQIDTNPPRQFIVGEAATGGSLAYWQLSGTDNSTLWMVIALADHECQSLQKVLINGKEKTRNGTTGEISGYGSKFVIRFYSGADTQTADSELVAASGGRWTNNERGKGICYAVVKLTYDEELFPEGIPEITFVVRGAKLFDPRTSTTAWTANSAVVLYNILRGVAPYDEKLIGMNVPAAAIRSAEAIAAANACDENVALKAGGTEKRYSCHAVFDSTQSNRDIIETILATMSGKLISTGGIYRILAGVAQSPVAALTDDDVIVTEPVVARPKTGRNELANAVLGSFTDPARGYASVAVPPRTSSADETADGGIRLARSFDLSAVTSRTQAQRIIEIERKRARRQASVAMRIRARHFGLEPGDWVTFNSDRRGYVAKTFEVRFTSGARDLTSDIVLGEIDEGIDDWSTADELDDNQVADLASAGPSLSSVSGIALSTVTVTASGSIQRPGLQLTWTPITDPTVIELEIEFRKLGDTVALSPNRVLDPSTGTYTWINGVQSGVQYEARVRPVTRPARGVSWSAWVSSATNTANHVVPVAALATTVEAGAVTQEALDAQTRHELSLVTAIDTIQGGVGDRLAQIAKELQKLSIAQIQQWTTTSSLKSRLDIEGARVAVETQTRQDLADSFASYQVIVDAALSNIASASSVSSLESRVTDAEGTITAQGSSITSLNATVGSQSTTISQIQTVQTTQSGWAARWAVNIDANGYSQGFVTLDTTGSQSVFGVLANKFVVAQPGVTGGTPVTVFTIGQLNGTPGIGLSGNLIVDGTIAARHLSVSSLSAISANIGTVTAGTIRNPANTLIFDLPNLRLYRTDGKMDIDFNNQRLRMGA